MIGNISKDIMEFNKTTFFIEYLWINFRVICMACLDAVVENLITRSDAERHFDLESCMGLYICLLFSVNWFKPFYSAFTLLDPHAGGSIFCQCSLLHSL